ncbi:hypothetical protein UA19_01194 [Burkholderia multivorans]|nr:hypothetical protein NP80_2154 [Burkholderia multivorans ATCC BAA-247]SAK15537.1 hypothetical protein UA21_01197 [Burkholderia multivorans]SAK15568.1 hypothetical protein UA19_01194 [Burkholderia multivorans]SPU80364.1 Uncharacterised protein [Burkholderia multivorans]
MKERLNRTFPKLCITTMKVFAHYLVAFPLRVNYNHYPKHHTINEPNR